MCELYDPRLSRSDYLDWPPRKKRQQRDREREALLPKWIAEDPDPQKRNALRLWRDSILSRLQPSRHTKDRMEEQIARLPKAFLPFVTTACQRVVLGPNNEVYALTKYVSRVKNVSPSTYMKGELLVPPPESI